MNSFMDYIIRAFGTSTDWNHDNSYSSLTATSDALLAFETPSNLSLNVSSLSTAKFATSYTLSTLGQIDGSLSYLYTNHPLFYVPCQSPNIPLRSLVRGYRDLRLPRLPAHELEKVVERKPTLLHATLALPPPSTLTALYARRINYQTLLSLSLYSKSLTSSAANSPSPPASVLAHVQHDTGKYSIEGLASTDNALLGARGLWNFGFSAPSLASTSIAASLDDSIPPQDPAMAYRNRLASKPSLLSAGAEFYYSPFSHVIGMSTGLRFTTLASHIKPATAHSSKPLTGTSASLLTPANITHSSFPYTMTLTLNPLVGSIASTYSVKPTPNLALSSRCDFNFYSWESRYVVGAEVWRGKTLKVDDPVAWAREKLDNWFTEEEKALRDARTEREEENVLKVRVDDAWNLKALWTGRIKSLLVSAGVSVSPVTKRPASISEDGIKRWTGSVGVSVAYST